VLSPAGAARIDRRSSWQRPVGIAAAALAVLTAAGSTAEVVRIGHSGAKAVWSVTPAAR
jgi:hypothetical protein